MVVAPADQIGISNFHVIGIQHFRVLAVQAVVQNPWNIVPMDNSEDEGFFRREILGHGDDSGFYVVPPYAKRLAKQQMLVEQKENEIKASDQRPTLTARIVRDCRTAPIVGFRISRAECFCLLQGRMRPTSWRPR